MKFNTHSDLEGQHAFLSASNYHWIRYSDEKLESVYRNRMSTYRATELHDLAKNLIRLGVKLPDMATTLNLYVNDAIGYKMTPEQVLFYSYNAFGTADAICFRNNKLRIHDLKNGVTKVSFDQLLVYVAFFCLEYKIKPADIEIELRIYKDDDILIYVPVLEDIVPIMETIVRFDKMMDRIREEGLG